MGAFRAFSTDHCKVHWDVTTYVFLCPRLDSNSLVNLGKFKQTILPLGTGGHILVTQVVWKISHLKLSSCFIQRGQLLYISFAHCERGLLWHLVRKRIYWPVIARKLSKPNSRALMNGQNHFLTSSRPFSILMIWSHRCSTILDLTRDIKYRYFEIPKPLVYNLFSEIESSK